MAKAFVTTDGEYGVDGFLSFDEEDLTYDQWEDVAGLSATDRYDYVEAILKGNTKRATSILEENGMRQS